MSRIIIKRVSTYFFYLIFSFGVGYFSMLGETDFIGGMSKSIIPILMTLLSVYAVISGQLITRMMSLNLEKDGITKIVKAMKRNIVIESVLLAFSFAFLASFSWLSGLVDNKEVFTESLRLLRNALICFDFLYFGYVVYDSIIGLYKLFGVSRHPSK